MTRSNIRTPHRRGANMVVANPQRLQSENGQRWACGRNVKRSIGGGRYDIVEVWALKERVNGKAVTRHTHCDRKAAEEWILQQEQDLPR